MCVSCVSEQIPMNAEQIDEKGNWAASNPAYELFCIQAEVHNHHLKSARSPSPDNTDAQMPDMPSEMAMDGDNDSLVNVSKSHRVNLKSCITCLTTTGIF